MSLAATCKIQMHYTECPTYIRQDSGCKHCPNFTRAEEPLISLSATPSKQGDPQMVELRMRVLSASLELLQGSSQPVVYRHFKGHEYVVEGFDWDATQDRQVIRYYRFGDTGPRMKHYTRTVEDFFGLVRDGPDRWQLRFCNVTPV